MELKVRWMSLFSFYSYLLVLSCFPPTQAGSSSISPATIYGTTINVSVSYPDYRFGEPTNISLAISVTFNNESISAANITAIHTRLYYSSVDVNQIGNEGYPSPSIHDTYAIADWFSTDYYGWYSPSIPPPHKIERQSAYVTTGSWNVDPLTLIPESTNMQQEKQAKLYVQVTLCFLDTNGEAIWRTAEWPHFWESGYHWVLFTGEGEAPYVTIYPKITQQLWLFRPEILAIVIISIGLVIVGFAVISIRRKKPLVERTMKKLQFVKIK